MKLSGLGFGVFLLLLLNVPATAQQQDVSEEPAVRATVTDYIEGYYTGDAARMEKSIHPHYLKHTISGGHGQFRVTEKTGLQIVQDVRATGAVDSHNKKEEITVLDVDGDVASAKLVTTYWTDYLTLAKSNGEWKIMSVVLREKY